MPLQLGQVLNDRYQIIAIWGSGGMGSIYRAYDQVMNRFVAVKEHAPDPTASPAGLVEAREQLRREARILGGLSHPNLPHTYDYFPLNLNEYVVMELVEGQSLEEIAQQFGGALEEWRVRDWAEQVLDALVYIHSRNVIHRDIKPANLILKPDGVVVLVDFGLVKLLDPHSPRTHTGMHGYGTAGYAPVEQFSAGMHTDPRSDLYSFGATLYRLLSGHVPVDVTARLATPGLLPPLRAVNAGVSAQMEWVVVRALEVRA